MIIDKKYSPFKIISEKIRDSFSFTRTIIDDNLQKMTQIDEKYSPFKCISDEIRDSLSLTRTIIDDNLQ
jgi:hypothetical protein